MGFPVSVAFNKPCSPSFSSVGFNSSLKFGSTLMALAEIYIHIRTFINGETNHRVSECAKNYLRRTVTGAELDDSPPSSLTTALYSPASSRTTLSMLRAILPSRLSSVLMWLHGTISSPSFNLDVDSFYFIRKVMEINMECTRAGCKNGTQKTCKG